MAALAIDEDKGLVGAEAAQRGQVNMVGTIRSRLLVVVERRRVGVDQGSQVKAGGRLPDLT